MGKFKNLFFYKKDVNTDFQKILKQKGLLSKSLNFFINGNHAVLKRFHIDSKIRKRSVAHTESNSYDSYLFGSDIYVEYSLSELKTLINDSYDSSFKSNDATIIIPVYNGLNHLKELFPSLLKNTDNSIKIIFIDDCSSDKNVVPLIQKFIEQYRNAELIQNKKNLGFTATVNLGMSKVKTNYAIWLNTDTIVPSNWVNKLLKPFFNFENIATTTPFTNSGFYFSFPNFGENNNFDADLEEINRCFENVIEYDIKRNTIHSGVGFCMGINMECWRKIGSLNVELFGKGYGEENDWCFRACEAKYRNVLVPNLFVEHRHGGSFNSAEKQKLCDEHQLILRNKFPHFMNDIVPTFGKLDKWRPYRQIVMLMQSNKNLTLVFDLEADNQNGASDFVTNELVSDKEKTFIFAKYTRDNTWSVVFNDKIDPKHTNSIVCRNVFDLKSLFEILDIKEVIVNNLAFNVSPEINVETIIFLKKTYGFKLTYLFHDYFAACPAIFLTAKNGVPCKFENEEKCNECLKNNQNRAVDRVDIVNWRKTFKQLLLCSDRLIFFSEYSSKLMLQFYPEIAGKFEIIEHKKIMNQGHAPYVAPKDKNKIVISFVGAFCKIKGSDFFSRLMKRFKQERIDAEFIVIGSYDRVSYDKNLKYIGRYSRNDLGRILTENKVSIAVYPSVCNETYSYVVQELMTLNVPFVVFPCGAPKERIINEHYKNAEIAHDVSDDALFNATISLLKKLNLI